MRRRQKYRPYFFDYKYERKTYKCIGKDYGDSVTANKGWIRNFTRWYRKYVYNREETKYKICNTYTEWKQYLLEKPFYNESDKENAIRYLCDQKRIADMILDIVKILIIPIYIALYSVTISLLDEQSLWEMIGFMICLIVVSAYLIIKYGEDVSFYKDYVECLKNDNVDSNTSHQE